MKPPHIMNNILIKVFLKKEISVYIYNGILFNHKEELNYVLCRKMGGTSYHHVK
jgi:hypothetical protein